MNSLQGAQNGLVSFELVKVSQAKVETQLDMAHLQLQTLVLLNLCNPDQHSKNVHV